jgi:hypothetical protein
MITKKDGLFIAQANPETMSFGLKWRKFVTHVPYTDNKFARNKYIKIGGNSISNGSLQRFSRAVVKDNVTTELLPGVQLLAASCRESGIDITKHKWGLTMVFAAHLGYGSTALRFTKKGFVNGGGDDATKPNWDLDNQWIWTKFFLDACQKGGALDKDTVDRIVRESKEYKQVPTFEDRYLVFKFNLVE